MKTPLIIAAFLGIALAGLLAAFVPEVASDRDKVRVRNALIFKIGEDSDFAWRPQVVEGFSAEVNGSVPEKYRELVAHLGTDVVDSGVKRAEMLASHLVTASKLSGKAIQADFDTTYSAITNDGNGYCSDYTLVLNGLAEASGLPIREWGMSFDRFGGDGHAFSEIYDQQLKKWVLIDSFYSFYFVDSENLPQSVLEVRRALSDIDGSDLFVKVIDSGAFRFPSADYAITYYSRGMNNLFLISGESVFAYDKNSLVKAAGKISRSVEQLLAIALGVHPNILLLETSENQQAVRSLYTIKRLVTAILVVATLFGINLIWLLVLIVRKRKIASRLVRRRREM